MARLATLTPQQVRVLMMLSEGLLNKQIAYELSVSEATVKAHVSAILQKLGVESRTQAVIAAAKIEIGQWPQAARLEIEAARDSKFARVLSALLSELPNQSDTSNIDFSVPLNPKFAKSSPRNRANFGFGTLADASAHADVATRMTTAEFCRWVWRYSAAATRCTRHCAISARSAAGLSGLFSTWTSCARASSRTRGERSAVIRIAGRSAPKRRRNSAIASMPLPWSRW